MTKVKSKGHVAVTHGNKTIVFDKDEYVRRGGNLQFAHKVADENGVIDVPDEIARTLHASGSAEIVRNEKPKSEPVKASKPEEASWFEDDDDPWNQPDEDEWMADEEGSDDENPFVGDDEKVREPNVAETRKSDKAARQAPHAFPAQDNTPGKTDAPHENQRNESIVKFTPEEAGQPEEAPGAVKRDVPADGSLDLENLDSGHGKVNPKKK